MLARHKSLVAAVATGLAALVVGTTGVAAAQPTGRVATTQADSKAAPVKPAGVKAPRGLQGSSAAATAKTGAPSAASRALMSQDGACDVGDLCLYYVSQQSGYGSGYDTAHNDPYLWDNHFISAGLGQRSVVANNAESYWNRDPHTYAYVCTGTYSSGSCGWLAPNAYGNLTSTYSNNVESLFWANSSN